MTTAARVATDPASPTADRTPQRLRRRQWRALFALLVVATLGCARERAVCVVNERPPGFFPRLRLDRAALSETQRLVDPGYGPYRDGRRDGEIDGEELASELAPMLGGGEEKLLQSDCYWAAGGEDPSAPIDYLALSWEMVAQWRQDTPFLDAEASATRVGQCRGRNPIDGKPVVFCGHESERGNPPYESEEMCQSATRFQAGVAFGPIIPGDDECIAFDIVDRDLDARAFSGPIELERVRPQGSDDVCPARVMPPPDPEDDWLLEAGLVERRIGRFAGTVELIAQRVGCGAREPVAAEGDGAFRLVNRGDAEDVVNWLGPNVFTVHGRRTVRRPMAPAAGSGLYVWQTEVDTQPGEGGGRRWRENWSPQVLVEGVRVYREAADGSRQAVAGDAGVTIQGDYGGADNPRWQCSERIDEGDATYFPIHLEDESPDCDVRVESREGTTPTYALEFLDLVSGAIEIPLRWEIETEEAVPAGETVFLEFELRAVRGGAALTADPLHDFGRLATGTTGRGLVTVENQGENAVRIDFMALGGADAADFRFRALGEQVWLPLPFERVPDPAGGADLALLPGYEGEPALFDWALPYGAPTLRLSAADHGGQTVTIYGADVDFGTGRPVLVDPNATLTIAPSDPAGSLPFGRAAYRAAELPVVVPPGGRLEVTVTATPSVPVPRQAHLRVDYVQASDPSIGGSIATVLIAEGITGPTLAVLPETVAVVAGEERRVAVESIGNLPLARGAIAISGPEAGAFAITSEHPPTRSLAPGEAELFAVRFAPAALPPFDQPATATLEIATDAGPATILLYGRSPLATRPALDFNADHAVQAVHLHNLSGKAIERRTVTLFGPDRDRFTLSPLPGPSWTTIGPRRNELLFHVHYQPLCTPPLPLSGRREATLGIDTDAGPIEIALSAVIAVDDCP